MGKETESSAMEQEALNNAAANATPAPAVTVTETPAPANGTPAPPSPVPSQPVADDTAEAMKLMKQLGVTKLWRTLKDGYWFSIERSAKAHLEKVGGLIKLYEDTTPKK